MYNCGFLINSNPRKSESLRQAGIFVMIIVIIR